MTCSSPGRSKSRRVRVAFAVEPPEDHFFLTVEGAVRHGEWLRQMKERFHEKSRSSRLSASPTSTTVSGSESKGPKVALR